MFHLTAIPLPIEAMFWGLLSGSALIIGALVGYYLPMPRRNIGFVMAFGSGVLISALSFELMDKAYHKGGFEATAIGFFGGALLYAGANYIINLRGARQRKRSGTQQHTEANNPGSGTAIAVGSVIDGVPESIAIGVSMIEGTGVNIAAVVAIFLSNIPESLSSAAGMKKAGRSRRYVFSVWGGIMLLCGISAVAGYTLFQSFPPQVVGASLAVAAGGILVMLSTTMIPEAFEDCHDYAGLFTVAGFLAAFILSEIG